MAKKYSRGPASSFFESLESRQLLSHTVFTTRLQLTATVENGVLGSTLTIPSAAKLTAAGKPLRTATIYLVEDNTTVVGEGQTGRSGYLSLDVPNFYVGTHTLTAYFQGSERYVKSQSGSYNLTITAPTTHTTTADGVQEYVISQGSGATLQEGDNFTADYTGFLQSNGDVFDASVLHQPGPSSFTDDAAHLIPGFAEGVAGMKVGETIALLIPSAEGYGSQANGNIPANSTLVFVVHLDSVG
jgi:hypothetical protein